MRRRFPRPLVALSFVSFGLLSITPPVAAQESSPARTLGELAPLAPPGRRVEVTTTSGFTVRGEVASVDESVLRVRTENGIRDFGEGDLRDVRGQGDRLWDGAVAGALAGFGAGAVMGASCSDEKALCVVVGGAFIGAPIGAVVGLLIDRAAPHREVLYSSSGPVTLWRFDPVIGSERYGARLAIRF